MRPKVLRVDFRVSDAGTLALVAGQKYDVRLEYYEAGGGAVCRLQWSYPGQTTQAIPQGQLFAPGSSAAGAPLASARAAGTAQAEASRGPVSGSLAVYPTPAAAEFTVSYAAEAAQAATLTLLDALGRLVVQQLVQLQPGPNQFVLAPGRSVPGGIYRVVLTVAGGQRQARQVVLTR